MGTYPEYHTSKDNLDFVTADSMFESFIVLLNLIYVLEKNKKYQTLNPYGEPMLGKYGLYPSVGGKVKGNFDFTRSLRFLLNFSDGQHDLVDIAERFGSPVWGFEEHLEKLINARLLSIIY